MGDLPFQRMTGLSLSPVDPDYEAWRADDANREPATEAGRALLRSDFDTTGWGPRLVREHVTKAVFAIEREAVADLRASLAAEVDAALARRGLDGPISGMWERGYRDGNRDARALIEGDTDARER